METNKPLGNAKVSHVIEIGKIRVIHSSLDMQLYSQAFDRLIFVLKIGVIGLVEEEWISTLWTVDCDEIIYEPFVEVGKKLAVQLKTEQVRSNFISAPIIFIFIRSF